MPKRFMSIWFRYLKTDWLIRRRPLFMKLPFVFASPDHGRIVVTAANIFATTQGVHAGMVLADARAIIPSLQVFDDEPGRDATLLNGLADWLIRFTPLVSIDLPDGLILDITGCAHLWGGEQQYLTAISNRFNNFGYTTHMAIADTIGTAWAIARFGKDRFIIEKGQQETALLSLPPSACRLEAETTVLLEKLGLRHISQFISMPRPALRRRFGKDFLKRLDQCLGHEEEIMQPVFPVVVYEERLPCLEPIVTATGIEIALQRSLDMLCNRLKQEEKGLRMALFTCFRVDNKMEKIEIGTNRPSCNSKHLFKLFEDKISSIEPALGIELFILQALKVEEINPVQEKLFGDNAALDDIALGELLDRIGSKTGSQHIQRYMPDEHYLPERSYKPVYSLSEKAEATWKVEKPRPLKLLPSPEPIEVTAPVPDYPPMMFSYKGKLHKITKADGPERIEPEWWLQQGQHRDYYYVEDEQGYRYWLFRAGHYDVGKSYQWFIHGFFA